MKKGFQLFQAQLIIVDELGYQLGGGALEVAFYQQVDAFFPVIGLADTRLVVVIAALDLVLDVTFFHEDLQEGGDGVGVGFGFGCFVDDVFEEAFSQAPKYLHYLFFGLCEWFIGAHFIKLSF